MDKAKRALIHIAGIEIEVFQLPNSEYVMSQSQVAEAIDIAEISIRRFLSDKQLKPLTGKGYEFDKTKIEKDWVGRGNRQTIKPIPINLASEFWVTQAFKGNIKAQSLAYACIQEALERRCDTAFQQVKDEEEYEDIAVNNRASWQESRRFLLDKLNRVYTLLAKCHLRCHTKCHLKCHPECHTARRHKCTFHRHILNV